MWADIGPLEVSVVGYRTVEALHESDLKRIQLSKPAMSVLPHGHTPEASDRQGDSETRTPRPTCHPVPYRHPSWGRKAVTRQSER